VKQQRNNELLAVQNAISEQENERFIGSRVEVLVEGPSKRAEKRQDEGDMVQLTGRTPCDRVVVFDGDRRLVGQLVPVAIYEVTAHTLFGAPGTCPVGPPIVEMA
jgi:tRNA-2-methylthio-N6-dimethylallyladenosine synthase